MKIHFIQIKTVAFVLAAAFMATACHEHKEGDGHDHGSEKTGTTAENHEEESSDIASLTQEQINAVRITMGTVEQKNLTATFKANGILRVPNNNKANATSLYGGVITKLNVQVGDWVKKGQVIAVIENPQFIQLQEEYLTIGSKITLAEQELQRQKELNEGNAGTVRNLQTATSEINTLRTRKASLQKQIQMMGIQPNSVSDANLKNALLVTSPINGTISDVFSMIGSYVDVSSPVAEIVDNTSLHLDLQVFEKDLPKVKVGQAINFTVTNNPTTVYTAKVFSIGASFENQSKTIAIHSNVIGNKSGLIDGMNITGTISLENVLMSAVPNDAIVEADGKYYIFIQTDKKAPVHKEDGHDDHGHAHDEGESGHAHQDEKEAAAHAKEQIVTNFQKIEIVKGTTDMGYTAITTVSEIPANAKVVVKGAFFINAKMSDSGGHAHAH